MLTDASTTLKHQKEVVGDERKQEEEEEEERKRMWKLSLRPKGKGGRRGKEERVEWALTPEPKASTPRSSYKDALICLKSLSSP